MDSAPGTTSSLLPHPPGPPPVWPPCVQIALAFLLGAATAFLIPYSIGQWRAVGRPLERTQVVYRVDLNRAEHAELRELPNVGETLAQRILEHRHRSGGFRSVDDLRQVPGIGAATVEQLRPWVYVSVPAGDPSAPVEAAPAHSFPPKKTADLREPIHLNLASAEELQRLPGIGPKLSQRIVDERAKGPFRSAEDLRRVSGIGPKTIEKLRAYVTTENRPAAAAEE